MNALIETKRYHKNVKAIPAVICTLFLLAVFCSSALAANTCTVFLPSGSGYEVNAVSGYSANNLAPGSSFCFTLTVHNGYELSTPVVTVNGDTLEPINNVYTIYNITADKQVSVSGVTRNAYRVSLPSGEGYVLTPSLGYDKDNVLHGDSFKFYIGILSGYTDSVPAVYLNGTALTADSDGCYLISGIASDITGISVSGVIKNMYDIEFQNYDGTRLTTESTAHGDIPVYSGETPKKAATAQYSYSFSGWSPEICAADAEAVYTASFTSQLKQYEVVFLNYDGTELYRTSVPYGGSAEYSGKPEKPQDDSGAYAFSGWSVQTSYITGYTVAVARYSHEHVYTGFVKAATCTDKGYTIHTCEACGYSYTAEWTAKLPHTYGEWSAITEATETAQGVKQRFCTECNARDTAIIPVITQEKPDAPDDGEKQETFSWFKFLFQKLIDFFKSLFLK